MLVLLCLVLLGGAYLLLRTPAWYRIPQVAPEDRQRLRNDLIHAEQAFTESLRSGRPFVYHIYDEDLNRWMVMRHKIYPLIDEMLPSIFADPFILFREGRIIVAGLYQVAGLDAVLAMEIEPTYQDDAILLKVSSIHCGSLPLPKRFVSSHLGQFLCYREGDMWPGSPAMSGDLLTGLSISAEGWWKNGGIDYQVQGLRVAVGQLDLSIQPLGRQVDRKHISQSSLD